jgi:hypothetical protein
LDDEGKMNSMTMSRPERKPAPVRPPETKKLAELILSRALAPTLEGAEKLVEMLGDQAGLAEQAIRCAPENPRAQQWLDGMIREARVRYRSAYGRKPVARQAAAAPLAMSVVPTQIVPQPEPRLEMSANLREGVDVIHVYGKDHALTIEASETRGKGAGAGLATIMVEAAGAGTVPKSYNWADKLRFQVTAQELPFVAAVFFGKLPRVEFANHGENCDKGLSLEDQPERGGVYVRLWARGRNHTVPVPTGSIAPIAALCLRQLQKQLLLDADGAERVMCAAAQRYRPRAKTQAHPPAG